MVLLKRFDDNIVHAKVLLDHGESPTLATDVMNNCPLHTGGDNLSTLAALGEDYADLEKDLLEASASCVTRPSSTRNWRITWSGRSRSRVRNATTVC